MPVFPNFVWILVFMEVYAWFKLMPCDQGCKETEAHTGLAMRFASAVKPRQFSSKISGPN